MNQTEQINKAEKLKAFLKIYKEYAFVNTGMDVVLIDKGKADYGENSK